ncbi:nuclear transport factor 2 family protein [Kitasatospora sp. NBC_00458]|uniref:nuclear transport factor 2 family protein n=1 Tax=Kitasatospora sp. NBC_00458 TaxID=2903568 RepID=UPI002E188E26
MADFDAVADAFVRHYYGTFDGGSAARSKLTELYRPESLLTWESRRVQGATGIAAALARPELAAVKHRISTVDAQPTPGGGVLVTVVGTIAVGSAFDKPMLFSEVFALQPVPDGEEGDYFVRNQIARLILG